MVGTSEYSSYADAKSRCDNPNHHAWEYYGARGIRFLFDSFEQFYAELGPRPSGLSLDRINNDRHYEPGNVRWATTHEQALNKRSRIFKLTIEQRQEIIRRRRAGESGPKLAAEFGVHSARIYSLVKQAS